MNDDFVQDDCFMPAGEVALRVAVFLLSKSECKTPVLVRINSGGLKLGKNRCLLINSLITELGLKLQTEMKDHPWCGYYLVGNKELHIRSSLPEADITTTLGNNRILVQCKGGRTLIKNERTNPEYSALLGAIAQTILSDTVIASDLLYVAVPENYIFRRMILSHKEKPMIKQLNIKFIVVGRDGHVHELFNEAEQ